MAEDGNLRGWMHKKGGLRTNWLRRWFEVSGHELRYFSEGKPSLFPADKNAEAAH